MNTDLRRVILDAVKGFAGRPIDEASVSLLGALGYESRRTLELSPSPSSFLETFDTVGSGFNPDKALVKCWKSIHFIFQFTDSEVQSAGGQHMLDFGTDYSPQDYQSYTFIAVDLAPPPRKEPYTRSRLASLIEKYRCRSFRELHAAWGKVLNLETLNKQFYNRIQEWFFWATQEVSFPRHRDAKPDVINRIGLIRLLTRVIFCWFGREKGIIPGRLFDQSTVEAMLRGFDPTSRTQRRPRGERS